MPSTPVTLLTSIVESRENSSGGVETVRYNLAGEAHARALVDAVVEHYHRITSRTRPTLSLLRELTGAPVSIAYTVHNVFGASFIEAREGTLMPVGDYYPGADADSALDGRLVLRPAGNRSRGIGLDAVDVLDVERGYGHLDRLRGLVAVCQNRLPRAEPLTREDLLALPSYNADIDAEAPTFIRLAVMGTWRGPDGESPAAIWLLHSYDSDDDVAEGFLLVDPARGFSEHGSIYGRNLLRVGGRIPLPATDSGVISEPDGTPLTLSRCFGLGDLPQEQWLAHFTR